MIYSKEILSSVAWKQYRLHAGPWMRRNGWMVGLQLETLGPSERSYRFSFSRPALVSVQCSLRAMWQGGSKPPSSLLSHENPRRLICEENKGTSSQDLTEKSFLTSSGSETEPSKSHTLLTSLVPWLGFDLAETASALREAEAKHKKPNSAKDQVVEAECKDNPAQWKWTSSRREGGLTPEERLQSVSSRLPTFIHLTPVPLSPPYVNWASQEGCLFHLKFSRQSSDFLLFHLMGFFLSLSHCHFGLLFLISTT